MGTNGTSTNAWTTTTNGPTAAARIFNDTIIHIRIGSTYSATQFNYNRQQRYISNKRSSTPTIRRTSTLHSNIAVSSSTSATTTTEPTTPHAAATLLSTRPAVHATILITPAR